MKKLITLAAVFTLCLLFALNVCAAQDYFVWDFRDPAVVDKWTASTTTSMLVTKDGTIVSGSGNDINLAYSSSDNINLADYKYFVTVMANPSTLGTFQFYHWTSTSSGNPRLETTVQPVEGVTTVAFDLNEAVPDTACWDGTVKKVRLDPLRGDIQRQVLLVYAGLFKDKATYETYAAAHPVEITEEMGEVALTTISPADIPEKVPVSNIPAKVFDMSDPEVSAK